MHSTHKLAAALRKAGLDEMANKAAAGYYHDFLSPLDLPSMQLANDLREANTPEAGLLLERHMRGEFDASKDESDEWMASREGRDTFETLLHDRSPLVTPADLGSRAYFALRPDAQAFDEVRIVTVPRYKQSGLSGNEWRISARVQFYRKGKLIFEKGYRDVQTACGFAYADYVTGIDDGKAFFGGNENGKCDQEGCSEPATVRYRLKKLYSNEGFESEPKQRTYRAFCDAHKIRGDGALEDNDDNYINAPTND